jgi:ribosomal protein S18 acetylase RimI-like enzyme
VELGVDSTNETRATALYERIGMRPGRRFDFYAKRLSGEDAVVDFPGRR